MAAQVLYFAPGSGLGHVTRALAVCMELRDLGVQAGIVTNSPFAEALSRLSKIAFTEIATAEWAVAAPLLLAEREPGLAIVDAFPNGMRGEWAARPATRMVHIARRLRLDKYGAAAGAWEGFALTIAIEALGPEHDALLRPPVVRLPGLIRLRPLRIHAAPPRELERMLERGAAMVVHGGPLKEVEQLLAMAGGDAPVAAITPWKLAGVKAFDYFPAANVMDRARHLYTGAGYNSIADTMHMRARHTAVAFPRRYDDQAARLAGVGGAGIDSTREAAEAIADLLRD